jgi:hypothetical protein
MRVSAGRVFFPRIIRGSLPIRITGSRSLMMSNGSVYRPPVNICVVEVPTLTV